MTNSLLRPSPQTRCDWKSLCSRGSRPASKSGRCSSRQGRQTKPTPWTVAHSSALSIETITLSPCKIGDETANPGSRRSAENLDLLFRPLFYKAKELSFQWIRCSNGRLSRASVWFGGPCRLLHLPLFEAGREPRLHSDFQSHRVCGDGRKSEFVIFVFFDAGGILARHRFPLLAILIEDPPGGR